MQIDLYREENLLSVLEGQSLIVTIVFPGLHRQVTSAVEQRPDSATLVVAVLQYQPAAGVKPLRALSDQMPDRIQAIFAGNQGCRRFMENISLRQMDVAFFDIRWIGHDQIKALRRQLIEPVTLSNGEG